jgi:RHH-type proline utilization regulon transcriptional repressor/proline dehydrogenase/delta 1-pyrroline-5-carboxylate dehydrogenase
VLASDDAPPAGDLILPASSRDDRPVHAAMDGRYLADERQCLLELLPLARPAPEDARAIADLARRLVEAVRANPETKGGLDAFLRQYDLSSQEGILLMCLAEALLRIPDDETADRLIKEKLAAGNWEEHLGDSPSLLVNASTWGLMLTGRLMRPDDELLRDPGSLFRRLVGRVGEPVVRTAMRQAMRIMGQQFVMGRTIDEALERARSSEHRRYRHSYDMLGEAALTAADATRYFESYEAAIGAIARAKPAGVDEIAAPSISVKLSALHPRYEQAQRERVLAELTPRLLALAEHARAGGIGLTVDAEEAERLELSLEVIERVARAPDLRDWNGFGLAVQAYQKRALKVIEWLEVLGASAGRRIPVRLVKGAYWDSEVKRAQERGLPGYPVFTRKVSTDVSYLACMRVLLERSPHLYPMFATHNAHTLASAIHYARGKHEFEMQRLHGMGEELYGQVVGEDGPGVACRVYAPVGSHEDLLPYLVRRLLENGANTSFVNRIVDERAPVEDIVADPVATLEALPVFPHPRIPLPTALYPDRRNSRGVNLHDTTAALSLAAEMESALARTWRAAPVVAGETLSGREVAVRDPADRRRVVGVVREADEQAVDRSLASAVVGQRAWDAAGANARAEALERASDLFELRRGEFVALLVREAGKTVPDAVAELREAVDYLRYYAARARTDFTPIALPGPTGERNTLELQGRGVFVCISPWNFPLAIFTGQVSAALAAGNAVLAKPAEVTPLVAAHAVRLMHEAGVPPDVLHFLPGPGRVIGARATSDPRVAGVAFTGSTETARRINVALAARPTAPIAVLVAETGGQNVMIVDSSALPEQVVLDAVQSGFNSAGQRCSALRVLIVQEDIAPRVLELLEGYARELVIGDPALLSTDIGPVIDAGSRDALADHVARIGARGRLLFQLPVPESCAHGTFFGPAAVEIERIDWLEQEVFGPVIHVLRYRARDLDAVVDAVNATGYGLTLGIHSRIDGTVRRIAERAGAGNVYVNRNMIGAVVGVQPFGGRGLSGTGPKAGGPHYVPRFATERTLTVNTAAVGGNASLLSLSGD